MRDLFIWILKLQAWLSPFLLAYYGYIVANKADSNAGFVGGMVGFMVGGILWLMYAGLADLAETIWHGQKELSAIKELLRKPEADPLAALDKKLDVVKASVDDLHEGLSDVMEETLNRLPKKDP